MTLNVALLRSVNVGPHQRLIMAQLRDCFVAANPFPDEAKADPSHATAFVMRTAPSDDAVAALTAAVAGPEKLVAKGADLYAYYPADIGHSKLTGSLIERKLGVWGAMRNWNTVLKLLSALDVGS